MDLNMNQPVLTIQTLLELTQKITVNFQDLPSIAEDMRQDLLRVGAGIPLDNPNEAMVSASLDRVDDHLGNIRKICEVVHQNNDLILAFLLALTVCGTCAYWDHTISGCLNPCSEATRKRDCGPTSPSCPLWEMHTDIYKHGTEKLGG